MKRTHIRQNMVQLLALLVTTFALAGCASGVLVDHSFGFDALSDSPDVTVLDYRYGDSKQPMARNPDYLLKEGRSLQRTSITGEMRRGDFLYVKWRIKNTGEIREDTVDLRQRLPSNIRNHRVYFMIKETQLYVYLVPQDGVRRPPNKPPIGPAVYDYLDVKLIYPDQRK